MQQILQAFGGPGRTALSFAPTYSMYPEYARNTHTRWVTGQREDDFTVDVDRAVALIAAEQPDVVLLTSPNNPTGTALPLDTVRAVVEAAPGVVVVDEAYAEFRRDGTPTSLELLDEHPRLLVTRTMSKAFALAGGRLGYVAADAAIIDALRIVRLPVPPVRRDPGDRDRGAQPQRGAACPGRRAATSPRRDSRPGCGSRASRLRSPMRTSCCSAGSTIDTPSGRAWSTAAS